MAQKPIYKTCKGCNKPFPAQFDKTNSGYCPPCFETYKQQERIRMEQQWETQRQRERSANYQVWRTQGIWHGFFDLWKAEHQEAMPKLESDFIKQLLMLCHPDKHANSPLATKVTQKLLEMRG